MACWQITWISTRQWYSSLPVSSRSRWSASHSTAIPTFHECKLGIENVCRLPWSWSATGTRKLAACSGKNITNVLMESNLVDADALSSNQSRLYKHTDWPPFYPAWRTTNKECVSHWYHCTQAFWVHTYILNEWYACMTWCHAFYFRPTYIDFTLVRMHWLQMVCVSVTPIFWRMLNALFTRVGMNCLLWTLCGTCRVVRACGDTMASNSSGNCLIFLNACLSW